MSVVTQHWLPSRENQGHLHNGKVTLPAVEVAKRGGTSVGSKS
jgi:hypothetical protein